VLITMQHIG